MEKLLMFDLIAIAVILMLLVLYPSFKWMGRHKPKSKKDPHHSH